MRVFFFFAYSCKALCSHVIQSVDIRSRVVIRSAASHIAKDEVTIVRAAKFFVALISLKTEYHEQKIGADVIST